MTTPSTDPPHDYPDRAMRDALLHPRNLRAVVSAVAPEVVDGLVYERAAVVPLAYLLDDWRKRERDILVRIPFRDGSGRELLLCLLIEHQSTTDQAMPLRLLLYAVLYWEQEWRAWEAGHPRGQPLRLTPILPVVLHTGQECWDTNRRLADLFDVPEPLAIWLPEWRMPLWDLPEHTADNLLASGEPFWQTLAVARAEKEETDEFRRVLSEVLKRLEPLGLSENVYWHQLVRMVLYWSLYRRPHREYGALIDAARASHNNVALQQEFASMSQTLEKTWEQELKERYLAQGEERGEERGEARGQLLALRKTLRTQVEQRFGPLPEALPGRIAAADRDQLEAALERILAVATPEELGL